MTDELMTPDEIEGLAKRIDGMSPPAQLRLAAEFIEQGRLGLAKAIVDRISAELFTLIFAVASHESDVERARR